MVWKHSCNELFRYLLKEKDPTIDETESFETDRREETNSFILFQNHYKTFNFPVCRSFKKKRKTFPTTNLAMPQKILTHNSGEKGDDLNQDELKPAAEFSNFRRISQSAVTTETGKNDVTVTSQL